VILQKTSERPGFLLIQPAKTAQSHPDSARIISKVDTIPLKFSKDTLDAPVNFEAEDSAVIMVPEKKVVLYGKAHTTYKDVVLDAPRVELDQRTNILTASGTKDSLGETLVRARMQQSDNKFQSDTIRYNFKSQRGLLSSTYTTQNEMHIIADIAKKVDSNTVFIQGGRFTTCDLDEPHFAFRTKKLKIINNKAAVSGPMHPEFEGVPLPIYLPFGYFPLNKGRHSGLLPPQFVVTEQQGLGLEGLGYYRVLNEYIDATLRGSIYSYGGWRGDLTSTYRKRYRFNGQVNLSLQNTRVNFPGDPDYEQSRTFNIMWNHSVDQRARPGVTFSANVNAGSTKYNRFLPSNLARNLQNQLTSSISYSKNWIGKPYQLTMSANHSQNSQTRLVNLTLPDATFNVSTQYPFQRKEQVGEQKWYEKLGIGYTGSLRNQIAFYDSAFTVKKLLDTLTWGASHVLPLTLSLPPVGPLILSPSISYQQQWIMSRSILQWDPTAKQVDTVTKKGLYTAHSVSVGMGISTNIFGTFNFRKSRLIAIRHSIRPAFSISYSPNMARGYYKSVQSDSAGSRMIYNAYSVAGTNIFTGFGNNEFGGMSFRLDNSLEAKLRSKKDTGNNAIKKIRLIDGFGFNTNYNFLLDSFQMSNIELYLRSTLFDKVNLNFTATMSPYAVDENARVIKDYAWAKGYGLGRITNGSLALSTQFKSKPRDAAKGNTTTTAAAAGSRITDPLLLADQSRLLDYMRRNPNEFVDFNVPYDVSFDLAMNFTRSFEKDYKVKTDMFASINFRSSFSLTEKWNFSTYGYYDLNTMKLQALSLAINRDLHCWQMSIGLSPLGAQRYFSISISPKSGLLQNLKINRTRVFTDF
jgi:LPS-assembly protein